MNEKIKVKSKNNYLYTFVIPLMLLIAFLGLTFREKRKKHFYIPIGIIGVYLVVEKEYHRKTNRAEILNKIKNFSRK